MDSDEYTNGNDQNASHAPEVTAKAELWGLPEPDQGAAVDLPWSVPAREPDSSPGAWRAGEAAQYRGLLAAAQTLARFGERLAWFPQDVEERFALASVSAVLRGEGVWLGPEKIALYQALRFGADDDARDLARAGWAMRRLQGAGRASGPLDGVHGFLGRSVALAPDPEVQMFADDRPLGVELEVLGADWIAAVQGVKDLHPLTQGAFAFARWRGQGLTPFEELLEPCIAVMRIGAVGIAPFLPLAEGHNIGRLAVGGSVEARLATFYTAVEAGALKALMQLDRLAEWHKRAVRTTAGLSGRTPACLIGVLLRLPVVSAELVSAALSCSRPTARRNLDLFAARGLIREVTGQDRYRFWAVKL